MTITTIALRSSGEAHVSLMQDSGFRSGPAVLEKLAEAINSAHGAAQHFADSAQSAARITIEAAVACGGYLREVKSRLPHGALTPWLKRNTSVTPRTARNYMRLHVWVGSHQKDILARKPHSLRQFYILSGILPEDESRNRPDEKPDDLARLRRLVRRTCLEATAHRDFADREKLKKTLEPLIALLNEVEAESTGPG